MKEQQQNSFYIYSCYHWNKLYNRDFFISRLCRNWNSYIEKRLTSPTRCAPQQAIWFVAPCDLYGFLIFYSQANIWRWRNDGSFAEANGRFRSLVLFVSTCTRYSKESLLQLKFDALLLISVIKIILDGHQQVKGFRNGRCGKCLCGEMPTKGSLRSKLNLWWHLESPWNIYIALLCLSAMFYRGEYN